MLPITPLLHMMAPAGKRARLSVLIFHRVLRQPDPLFPGEMYAQRFDAVCRWLAAWFNVLPLDQAVSRLKAGSLPARAACITFDDGYADNHEVAASILGRHGLSATFFIATGFLDGGRMWNDTVIESVRQAGAATLELGHVGRFPIATIAEKRAAIDSVIGHIKYMPVAERLAIAAQVANAAHVEPPTDLMMTSNHVKALRHMGMQIGAHTVSHPILASIPDDDAKDEIRRSKAVLEALLQEPVILFAYPNGKPGRDYLAKHALMVKQAGFTAAVSTASGVSTGSVDPFQVPRFSPWDTASLKYGIRLLVNLRNVQPQMA